MIQSIDSVLELSSREILTVVDRSIFIAVVVVQPRLCVAPGVMTSLAAVDAPAREQPNQL